MRALQRKRTHRCIEEYRVVSVKFTRYPTGEILSILLLCLVQICTILILILLLQIVSGLGIKEVFTAPRVARGINGLHGRYFQHAHFTPIVGVGKRGTY